MSVEKAEAGQENIGLEGLRWRDQIDIDISE